MQDPFTELGGADKGIDGDVLPACQMKSRIMDAIDL